MAEKPKDPPQININIDQPRYDQETYFGRARHFFQITNPMNLFASAATLENARCLVTKYRCKEPLPEDITEEELWRAKVLYDSAFHPDTGEKMNLIGRMSAQVPMNMMITGGMMAFYKTTPAVLFWQWLNQSFNALVNYTNRSGDTGSTNKQIMTSYVLATSGAVATALGLNRLFRNAPPLVGRLVPLCAVAAANCINIPLMRAQELKNGTPIYDENGNKLGYSKRAAQAGISQVVLSRIAMATPGMFLTPVLMNYLERRGTLCRYPWINLPVQIGFVGLCLTFATPLACAFFKQKSQFAYHHIEPELRNSPPLVGRLVPMFAVAAANLVNVPLMRIQELKNGTPIYDENNKKLGYSRRAARSGVIQVIISRIAIMAIPGMSLTAAFMNQLERRGVLCKYPWINLPVHVGFGGLCISLATPLGCALYKQKSRFPYHRIEPELKEILDKKCNHTPKFIYFNKGL